jgi:hypothetical protein
VTDTFYKHSLTVSLCDLDAREAVPGANVCRFFEETTMRGSAHLGFDLEWYRAHDRFWVMRPMQIERACAPRDLDQVTRHPEKPARFEFSSKRRAPFYQADSAQPRLDIF